MDARTATAGEGGLSAIVAFALRKPGQTLAIVLAAHLLVWTLLPLLISHNLELDLAEDLALGKEWQLGYWKHPPLPWWIADLAYRLTGHVEVVFALGPLAVVGCFIAVYLLARDIAGPVQALIATLSLVGTHYYNYSAVKFAHDQLQLPFWALTALFFYRGLVRGRALDWVLAGAMLGLAFWSKYAVFALAISLVLFLLIDPVARQSLRTSGPWLMAASFLVVIAPNAWWLVDSGFLPLQYVGDRAKIPQRAYQYVTFPLTWMASQVFFMHPMLILLGFTLFPRTHAAPPATAHSSFARRYVTTLAFMPFVVVTAAAIATSRAPIAMWGYPLWSLLPLAALLWFGPVNDLRRISVFAAGVVILLVVFPVLYVGTQVAGDLTARAQIQWRLLSQDSRRDDLDLIYEIVKLNRPTTPIQRSEPKLMIEIVEILPDFQADLLTFFREKSRLPRHIREILARDFYAARTRVIASEFPGRQLAQHLTHEWRQTTNAPLRYVAGTEFAANNVAVYSPDRPHVVVHGRPRISPWIRGEDLKRSGVLILWEEGLPLAHPDEWRKTFGAQGAPRLLEVRREGRNHTRPTRILYWIVPPRE